MIAFLLMIVLRPKGPARPALPVKPTPTEPAGREFLPLSPSPSPTPSSLELQKNKQAVVAQLPYIGDGFTVEYFPDRDWFFIQINKPPYETYAVSAKKWFTDRGLSPDDLNIEWGSTRGIAPKP